MDYMGRDVNLAIIPIYKLSVVPNLLGFPLKSMVL